jgi:hypothetical protein
MPKPKRRFCTILLSGLAASAFLLDSLRNQAIALKTPSAEVNECYRDVTTASRIIDRQVLMARL